MFLLATQLASSGWHVTYLTPDIKSAQVDQGVKLYPIRSSLADATVEKEISTSLSEINPDIIYQRGRSTFTKACYHYCSKNNIPLVFALSMDIDCRVFRNSLRLKEYGSRNPVRWLWTALRLGAQDLSSYRAMKSADLICCQTNYQKRKIEKSSTAHLAVIRNMHPKHQSKVTKSNPPVILWLASIKKWKQPELFLELAKQLADRPYQFVLAGKMADEHYRQEIMDMTKQPNFSYIEDVDLEASNELIEKASVFVNSSIGNEGFPNTFIQSWLREVPTVSLLFDPDNLIADEQLGFVSGTVGQLCKDVDLLASDERVCQEIGSRARHYAEKTFSTDHVFPKVEALFEIMISGK